MSTLWSKRLGIHDFVHTIGIFAIIHCSDYSVEMRNERFSFGDTFCVKRESVTSSGRACKGLVLSLCTDSM